MVFVTEKLPSTRLIPAKSVIAWSQLSIMTNLNKLADELRKYLEEQGVAIFQSYPRLLPELDSAAIYWDVAQFPDYRQFVAANPAATNCR